jgi:hypothetical protein
MGHEVDSSFQSFIFSHTKPNVFGLRQMVSLPWLKSSQVDVDGYISVHETKRENYCLTTLGLPTKKVWK